MKTVPGRTSPKAKAACDKGCTNGQCNGCASGTVSCNGTEKSVCNDEGVFEVEGVCDFVCVPGASEEAGEAGCLGVCAAEARRCGDGGRPEVCSKEGQWEENGAEATNGVCPSICRDGLCAGVCVPGQERCGNGPRDREVCNDEGQWVPKNRPARTIVSVTYAGSRPAVSHCADRPTGCNADGSGITCQGDVEYACRLNDGTGCAERANVLSSCGGRESCSSANTGASAGRCVCEPAPAVCEGDDRSAVHDPRVVNCSEDADGCLYVSEGPTSCPFGCQWHGECSQGQRQCDGQVGIRTCGSNNRYGNRQTFNNGYCTGSSGNASCQTCQNVTGCTSSGQRICYPEHRRHLRRQPNNRLFVTASPKIETCTGNLSCEPLAILLRVSVKIT